jgi:hypothetical protein
MKKKPKRRFNLSQDFVEGMYALSEGMKEAELPRIPEANGIVYLRYPNIPTVNTQRITNSQIDSSAVNTQWITNAQITFSTFTTSESNALMPGDIITLSSVVSNPVRYYRVSLITRDSSGTTTIEADSLEGMRYEIPQLQYNIRVTSAGVLGTNEEPIKKRFDALCSAKPKLNPFEHKRLIRVENME